MTVLALALLTSDLVAASPALPPATAKKAGDWTRFCKAADPSSQWKYADVQTAVVQLTPTPEPEILVSCCDVFDVGCEGTAFMVLEASAGRYSVIWTAPQADLEAGNVRLQVRDLRIDPDTPSVVVSTVSDGQSWVGGTISWVWLPSEAKFVASRKLTCDGDPCPDAMFK